MTNVSAFPIVGKPDCPTLKVPPFGRLYIPNEQPPPEPIDGPVPASPYIIPLPAPNPCVCLSFTSSPAADSRLRLVPPDANPKGLSLEIKPEDADNCCDGRFSVIPDLELPCVPFTMKDAVTHITIVNGQGQPAVTGNAVAAITKFSLTPNGCELTPEFDMWMSCIPFEVKDGEARIERGDSMKITKFGIEQDECSIRPSISMTMPCIPTQEYEYVIKTYAKGVATELRPETEVVDVDDEAGEEADGEVRPCKVKVSTKMDIPCPIKVDPTTVTIQAVPSDDVPDEQRIGLVLEPDPDGCGVNLKPLGDPVLKLPGSLVDIDLVWETSTASEDLEDEGKELTLQYKIKGSDGKTKTVKKRTGIRRTYVVRKSAFDDSSERGSFVNRRCEALVLGSTVVEETVFRTVPHTPCMDA